MIRIFCAFALLLAGLSPALAQGGPFSPRVTVNGKVITEFDIQQRIRFLELLKSPGDLAEEAYDALVEDRLRMDAAEKAGLIISEEEIIAGMEEFAGRANLELDAFLSTIAAEGVAPETFRDFVHSGIAWRQLVNARFGPRAQISEAEIDRAVALATRSGGAKVLLSEIILRADTPEFEAESRALADRLSQELRSAGQFAAAARQYSVSPSGQRGGRIDWLDLSALPPALVGQVLSLAPGETSDPVPIPNAIALFQLRAIQENDLPEPETLSVEYAYFYIPSGSPEEAQKLRDRVDTCDDLYGAAIKKPEEILQRETAPVSELPADLALALAKMDPGETTIRPNGGQMAVLMLCGRTPELGEDIDRGAIRQRLRNQRLASYADAYLEELKSEAIFRTP